MWVYSYRCQYDSSRSRALPCRLLKRKVPKERWANLFPFLFPLLQLICPYRHRYWCKWPNLKARISTSHRSMHGNFPKSTMRVRWRRPSDATPGSSKSSGGPRPGLQLKAQCRTCTWRTSAPKRTSPLSTSWRWRSFGPRRRQCLTFVLFFCLTGEHNQLLRSVAAGERAGISGTKRLGFNHHWAPRLVFLFSFHTSRCRVEAKRTAEPFPWHH